MEGNHLMTNNQNDLEDLPMMNNNPLYKLMKK